MRLECCGEQVLNCVRWTKLNERRNAVNRVIPDTARCCRIYF
jgi:hypothetical protein